MYLMGLCNIYGHIDSVYYVHQNISNFARNKIERKHDNQLNKTSPLVPKLTYIQLAL